MLYAVGGSQGCGKTTVLSGLQDNGFKVVNRKTSRSIQNDWGLTLEQINADKQLTMKFQHEILKRKIEDEAPYVHIDEPVFTERTHADLFTYAILVMGKEPSCSDFIDQYYADCTQAQQTYKRVFYLQGGLFPVEWDINRASANKHYCGLADRTMRYYTMEMLYNNREVGYETKFSVIGSKDRDERIRLIMESVNAK